VPKGSPGTAGHALHLVPVDVAHRAVSGKSPQCALRNGMTLASLWTRRKPRSGNLDVNKKMLYEKLEHEAAGGASLSELHAEIDKEGRLLTAVEREEAWLYAWALRKHEERRRLGSAWEEKKGYDDAGDAGAG
jgi:hypothetical protein